MINQDCENVVHSIHLRFKKSNLKKTLSCMKEKLCISDFSKKMTDCATLHPMR